MSKRCAHSANATVVKLKSGRWAVRCNHCGLDVAVHENSLPAWAKPYVERYKAEEVHQ